MTITDTAAPVRADATAGSPFTGTGSLMRFILRRDRIRIPVWLAALTLTTVSTATSFRDLYGDTANREQVARRP
jgi:ABC-2 type transport system permease protein